MVEDDRYCIDILTQIAAVTTALEGLASSSSTITSATASRARSPRATRRPDEKTPELLAAVQRFARTR